MRSTRSPWCALVHSILPNRSQPGSRAINVLALAATRWSPARRGRREVRAPSCLRVRASASRARSSVILSEVIHTVALKESPYDLPVFALSAGGRQSRLRRHALIRARTGRCDDPDGTARIVKWRKMTSPHPGGHARRPRREDVGAEADNPGLPRGPGAAAPFWADRAQPRRRYRLIPASNAVHFIPRHPGPPARWGGTRSRPLDHGGTAGPERRWTLEQLPAAQPCCCRANLRSRAICADLTGASASLKFRICQKRMKVPACCRRRFRQLDRRTASITHLIDGKRRSSSRSNGIATRGGRSCSSTPVAGEKCGDPPVKPTPATLVYQIHPARPLRAAYAGRPTRNKSRPGGGRAADARLLKPTTSVHRGSFVGCRFVADEGVEGRGPGCTCQLFAGKETRAAGEKLKAGCSESG